MADYINGIDVSFEVFQDTYYGMLKRIDDYVSKWFKKYDLKPTFSMLGQVSVSKENTWWDKIHYTCGYDEERTFDDIDSLASFIFNMLGTYVYVEVVVNGRIVASIEKGKLSDGFITNKPSPYISDGLFADENYEMFKGIDKKVEILDEHGVFIDDESKVIWVNTNKVAMVDCYNRANRYGDGYRMFFTSNMNENITMTNRFVNENEFNLLLGLLTKGERY